MFIKIKMAGFTLLEILLALFIFAIVAIMMTTALHQIFNNQGRIQAHSDSFASLQMALLLLSRDVEQTINRPVINAKGLMEGAFLGDSQSMTLTHAGLSNPTHQIGRSTLQRIRYSLDHGQFIRETYPVLDQSAKTLPQKRPLLTNVETLRFTYADQQGRLNSRWPIENQANNAPPAPTPTAVQVMITLKGLGSLTQTYLIPGQFLETKKSNPS